MDIVQQIKLMLPEYLRQMGIEVDGKGYALCPLHNDKKTKSFTINGPNGKYRWFCFGCQRGGDIFTLAHELEGLPLNGSDFIEVTIPALASRFNIPVKRTQRTQRKDDLDKKLLYDLFRFIKEKLVIDEVVEAFADQRSLDLSLFKRLGIGRIPSYRSLKTQLKRKFSDEILEKASIDHSDLFTDRIIFTLHDPIGRPVGFAGRYLGEDPDAKKYVNSFNSPVYNKSAYLYNLHLAKPDQPLYVVEGYTDVLALLQNGLNAVGLCGTAFTDQHLKLLKPFSKVILCLDGDAAGIQRMDVARQRLSNATCILIPEGMDPHDYIRLYGIDYFRRLPELDDLSWDIVTHQFYQPADVEVYLKRIARQLPFRHKEYLKLLAAHSNIPYQELAESLRELQNQRNLRILKKILDNKQQIASLTIQIEGVSNE